MVSGSRFALDQLQIMKSPCGMNTDTANLCSHQILLSEQSAARALQHSMSRTGPAIGYWAKGGRGGADLPASSNGHRAHLPMGLAPTRPTQLPYCPLALCTAHVHIWPLKLLTTTYAAVLLPLLAVAES